jgi:anti-sigma-K factor RskA
VSEHDQIRELIEGYALGVLDDQDRAEVEAHLTSGCPDCAKALEEARWLVTQLVYMAPSAEPSEMLRAGLMQKLRAEAPGSAAATQPTVISAASSPTKSAIPFWMWAGVAALLLLTAYSTWNAHQMQNEVAAINARAGEELKQREQLQHELLVATHEAHILTDPTSRKFTIWPNDKQMPKMEAAWHPAMGIYVSGQEVPMPKKNYVLQLWLIPKEAGGKPMPSHTFWPDKQGKVELMVDDPPDVMAQTKALAITEEPAGGSAQPTTTPMWVGGVS